MVNEVITLPLRIGANATRLGFRVAGQTAALALSAAERLIELAVPRPGEPVDAAQGPEASAAAQPLAHDEPPPTPSPPRAPDAVPTPAPEPEPAHVSREAHLVESFADPGAEAGAGAAVHIEEPWSGYRTMTANEVIARLADATREELAAVALYERAHRDRTTVLAAAESQLRRATAAARRRE